MKAACRAGDAAFESKASNPNRNERVESMSTVQARTADTQARHCTPGAAIKARKQRTFTGWKLDIIHAIDADGRFDRHPTAAKVLRCLVQHLNQKSGCCWPSIELIALKTGMAKSPRRVQRALRFLHDERLIESRTVWVNGRPRTYRRLVRENVQAMIDNMTTMHADWRAERRARSTPPQAEPSESGETKFGGTGETKFR
jgi:hypothetical protein